MDGDQIFLQPTRPPRFGERQLTRSDLEFIMEQIAALPTRRELIRFAVWVGLGLGVLAIIGVQMWWRWVWACSLL